MALLRLYVVGDALPRLELVALGLVPANVHALRTARAVLLLVLKSSAAWHGA